MKNLKKNFFALLCVLVCVFSLAGCAEELPDTSSSATTVKDSVTEFVEDLCSRSVEELDALLETYREGTPTEDAAIYDGITSLKTAIADSGSFISYEPGDVYYDPLERAYEAYGNAHFSERDCEFLMVVKTDNTITSFSFTPEYSMGEKLSKAGMNTVMGVGIVFVVLILISLIISCFGFIHKWETKKAEKEAAKAAAVAPEVVPEEVEDVTDDLELVAVITAAIAASEGTSSDGLIVRSIRRMPSQNKWRRG